MSNGERIIVKLDPDYNPTGKPMPDTLLKQMKADPDFAKLSEEEQKKVINKVENMVKDLEDVEKYGTLKEKLLKVASLESFCINEKAVPFVELASELDEALLEKAYPDSNNASSIHFAFALVNGAVTRMLLREGSQVNIGQCILELVAVDSNDGKIYDSRFNKEARDYMLSSSFLSSGKKIADIKAPISGKIFSLCEMRNILKQVAWNDDLFIISSIPDDTREAAIKWYKETTGKMPKYMTKYDKKLKAAEQKKNVDSFLSKWDL